MDQALDLPLSGIRIVDLVRGHLAPVTRYLAELGAQVDRIEIGVDPDDVDRLEDFAFNAGKRIHQLELDGDAARELISAAHIVVADSKQALDLPALVRDRRDLVAMTVSDFGSNTSLSGWKATGPVLHALSGELSRSGVRGREPLLPPGDLAYQCAASQAAFTLVTALYRSLRTGVGDHIDFSALDGAVQALDPGFGISGSATLGKPANLLSRARPAAGMQYPILQCADGYVRICVLSKRQWLGMFRWMGEPAEFASPDFEKLTFRYGSPELLPAIGRFFADKTRAKLEDQAKEFGVPVSGVVTFEECIATEHMQKRNAIVALPMADGSVAEIPNGVVCIDEGRAGVGLPRSDAGPEVTFPRTSGPSDRPFAGLRVLDMGVIVVGAEHGRLLGDQGADVLKVESKAFPDGNRQSYLPYGMSVSFAAGHRNKRGLGLNLRNAEGRELFLKLAAEADVILSNFKPGTLAKLGIDYDTVAAVNPGIVMTDSSAFGATGPWSKRMGYGPLVRAATGLTLAWRYPDDPEGFSDSVTIYPDHVAARVGATATVALLIRRLRTGCGGRASVAQAEVMLGHFAADVVRASKGQPTGVAPDWPWGPYPAKGDDEWCVVTNTDESSWLALCDVIGFKGGKPLRGAAARLAARKEIDVALTDWLANHTPDEAAIILQNSGVAAAPMLRLADLPAHSYYRDRRFYRTDNHPYLHELIITERRHATSAQIEDAMDAPAPLSGEHSCEVIADWLGLDDRAIENLVDAGVLETIDPAELAAFERTSR